MRVSIRARARRGDAPLLPVEDAELVVEISSPGIEPSRHAAVVWSISRRVCCCCGCMLPERRRSSRRGHGAGVQRQQQRP